MVVAEHPAESLVIPLRVVMRDVLAQGASQRVRAKKIIRSGHSDVIERMNLSISASVDRVRNAVVNLASRSIRQNRFSRKNPSIGSVRFLPT